MFENKKKLKSFLRKIENEQFQEQALEEIQINIILNCFNEEINNHFNIISNIFDEQPSEKTPTQEEIKLLSDFIIIVNKEKENIKKIINNHIKDLIDKTFLPKIKKNISQNSP